MAGNSIGKIFCITTFGESHGKGIGLVIDGCPSGLKVDLDKIQKALDQRRPGQSNIASPRSESDEFECLSGLFKSTTTGAPLAFFIANRDQKPMDYDKLKNVFRPSHADYTYQEKYGIRDHRGGGRSSARETAARVLAGAIAAQLLETIGMGILAYTSQIGTVKLQDQNYNQNDLADELNCPDKLTSAKMRAEILKAKEEKDSLGGIVTCVARGLPVGLGEPVFDRLEADLAKAMLSINASKGFDIGSGFEASSMKGSEHNDQMEMKYGKASFLSNHAGGVLGGISSGQELKFRVAFKPVASIGKQQKTISKGGESQSLKTEGRHDPCVVPRAVPIVSAMCAIVLADHYLRSLTSRI